MKAWTATAPVRVERRKANPDEAARTQAMEAKVEARLAALMPAAATPHQRRLIARAMLRACGALAAREIGPEETASLCGKLAGRHWGPVSRKGRA